MNRLWVRLALSFALVAAISVALIAFVANSQIEAAFHRYVNQNQIVESGLATQLAEYYAANGSWDGVQAVAGNLRPQGQGPGAGRGMRRGGYAIVVADASGRIVYDSVGAGSGMSMGRSHGAELTDAERAEAVSLEQDGVTIGYALAVSGPRSEAPTAAQFFLDQINQSLAQAALIAVAIGILLGVGVARGLSAPLGRLATAARQITKGKLDQRVPEKGSQEVANLASAFNDMADGLQKAETLRRNMVADIAHELRTPLTVIQGNLQAILDGVYPLDRSEIATIHDETLVLTRLVNDLRELALVEAGQLGLNLETIEIEPVLAQVKSMFDEMAQQRGVALTFNAPAPTSASFKVRADPDRVRQVAYNLLSNALSHTTAGGEVGVEIDASRPGEILVSICDTGYGISPDDLPHVFDRFWRADKARTRNQGGSGLGLAIAKQLIEAQHGRIGVESEPGQGSRFWFSLPAA